MPYPYIWAERCHTFGLKDARKLWSDTWDRWDILHGGFHQSSRCISKSSKRPYAQNDPKVTRRAFFSQYSGHVSAQILQNHIGGVFQPIHIWGVSQPILGACFSPFSGRVSAHIRGVFQPRNSPGLWPLACSDLVSMSMAISIVLFYISFLIRCRPRCHAHSLRPP